jgi:hypothetical protein
LQVFEETFTLRAMSPDEKSADAPAPNRKPTALNGWFVLSALAAGFAVGAWVFERQSLDAECEATLQDFISGRESPGPALRKLGPDVDTAGFYRRGEGGAHENVSVRSDSRRHADLL